MERARERERDNFYASEQSKEQHTPILCTFLGLWACVCVVCWWVGRGGLLLSCVWQILKIIVRFLRLACVIPLLPQLEQHSPGQKRRALRMRERVAESGGWHVWWKEEEYTSGIDVSEIYFIVRVESFGFCPVEGVLLYRMLIASSMQWKEGRSVPTYRHV